MKQNKFNSKFWLYNILPKKIVYCLELIRFEKPIGFLLLMWPCWFTLALFSNNNIKLYIFFFIGSFCMRSAGCIINDYIDRSIDKKVDRTSSRPLAMGNLNLIDISILISILLVISLIIIMQFNFMAVMVGLSSIPLIIIYPLMKRFTYWPQLFLGITFSWGVLIASAQSIETISLQAILLYIGCVFWTLGYDTIYAYQDREDDIKIDLKSTAILFSDSGKIFVMLFYFLFILFIFICKNIYAFNLLNFFVLFFILIFTLLYLNKWSLNSKLSSNNYFKKNNIFGLVIFLYLLLNNV